MNKKEKKQKMDQGEKREQRKQYLFVIQELTSREIKRKYARSYLGIVWSVLNPLLSMTVFVIDFFADVSIVLLRIIRFIT